MSIQRIPKLFFQKSRDRIPEYIQEMIKHYLSEGWTYTNYINGDEVLFFEQNPHSEFPDIIAKFNSLKRGEHRADLFRYYYLFLNGGVYIDSDAMIYQPIDEIIKDYSFFSVNSWVANTISNCVISCEKGHPIIYKALQQLYTMDISILDKNFHHICRELYTIYNNYDGDKSKCILFKEVKDVTGDNIVDSENKVVFRHFWRNKENIPNHLINICKKHTITSRNLVYACVFYNKDYFKLLDLLLKSMRMYSSHDSFDFLVMTSPEFEPEVKKMGLALNLELNIFSLDFKTIFQAACARLFIFDYPKISEYEKLLYLDTDIIIKGDLASIFTLPIEDLLHGIKSGHIWSQSFGSQFFDFGKIDQNLAGINSGTLLFLNSENMKNLFGRIRNHVETFTNEGNQPPYCMDQPFINYHAIKDSLYNNTLLNPLVSLFEGNETVDNYATSVICHFSYPIGNFGHKMYRMWNFLIKILSIPYNTLRPDIVGKKYSWNSGSGFIKFIIDETWNLVIETTWGKGTIQVLNSTWFIVEWKNHKHVLKFNDDLTNYISIRIHPNDFDFTSGSQIPSALNLYGDSHALLLFKGLQVEHRNLFEFSKTMFRVGRDQQIMNFRKSHNDSERIFCLVYGEVDVRAHIGKQVNYGRHHMQVCKELVEAYMRAIKTNIVQYKAIIIVAVPPPVDSADHKHLHNTPLPFIGTNSDRVIYTNDMNTMLNAACQENGYHFFDPFTFYKREDGMLNYSVSDGCIHIGKNDHFLKAFANLYGILQQPHIPIVLHTCDSYKQFWNPWFYYCKKFLQGPYKIYFLCEEEEPEFHAEVICFKTGKGEWGERLLKGLNAIPEKFIYYMQEDFWPCKPMDLSIYTPTFIEHGMDSLRIDSISYLYSLDSVSAKIPLYKFKQRSHYLMTHQFSLWNKAFFIKNINPSHDPWSNELEQSKVMATKPHSIYLYENNWYNPVVKKGILQPVGQKMIEDMITATL